MNGTDSSVEGNASLLPQERHGSRGTTVLAADWMRVTATLDGLIPLETSRDSRGWSLPRNGAHTPSTSTSSRTVDPTGLYFYTLTYPLLRSIDDLPYSSN